MRVIALGSVLATTVLGCSEASYIIVTMDVPPDLEQRNQLTTHTSELLAGSGCADLTIRIPFSEGDLDGFTFSLEGRVGDEAAICVEARGHEDAPLARGEASVRFGTATSSATVTLWSVCMDHIDCDDELFCTGEETCRDGTCTRGPPPCEAPPTCATAACDEDNDYCAITLDHSACPSGQACNRYLGCRSCDVLPYSSFCRPGEQCVYNPQEPAFGECVAQAGWWCNATTCGACNEDTRCGPQCVVCPPASTCGGEDVGCVLASCAGAADGSPCAITTVPDRSYDICQRGTCISPGTAEYDDGIDRTGFCIPGSSPTEWVCNASQPSFPLGDTGQRDCFTMTDVAISCLQADVACEPSVGTYCGQDAHHGWDATHLQDERFARSLKIPGEPTVIDNVTGLDWQGCATSISGDDCDSGGLAKFNWTRALAYCDNLNWGGHTNWHLPDRFELRSISSFSWNADHYGMTILDDVAFPGRQGYLSTTGTSQAEFWSASSDFQPLSGSQSDHAWFVDFISGETTSASKTDSHLVRCVRSEGNARSGSRWLRTVPVSDEPMVVDNATQLTWQGCAGGFRGPACATADGGSFGNWEVDIGYCRALTWAGFSDWRLPNVNELESLLDPSQTDPLHAYDQSAFPDMEVPDGEPPGTYIYAAATTKSIRDYISLGMHVIRFDYGFVSVAPKEATTAVRCVRGP